MNDISELISSVELLESAYEGGRLSDYLQDEESELFKIVPPELIGAYRSLAETGTAFKTISRRPFVDRAIFPAENFIKDPQVRFEADPVITFKYPEPDVLGPPEKLYIGCKIREPNATLRMTQIAAAREWGIEIKTEDLFFNQLLSTMYYRFARNRLIINISGINRLQEFFLARNRSLFVRPSKEVLGYRFEKLICEILNENEIVAHPATLEEDMLEQTDLRVKLSGLKRRNGARVQITLSQSHHQEKVDSLRRPRELVLISPTTIAEAVVSELRSPSIEDFDADQFWRELGSLPQSENEMAEELAKLFRRVIRSSTVHPGGPLFLVPVPLKILIRNFVEKACFRATEELRNRERVGGVSFRVSSRERIRKRRLKKRDGDNK